VNKKPKYKLTEMLDEVDYQDIFGMDAMNNMDDMSWDSKQKNLGNLSGQALGQAMMTKVRDVMMAEEGNQQELEDLAVQIVKEAYPVVEYAGIIIDAKLDLSPETQKHEDEVPLDDDPEELDDKKRRIINGITQGASQRGTFNYKMYDDYIKQIDPSLPQKYDDMMKLVFGQFDSSDSISYLKNMLKDQGEKREGGTVRVTWNEEEDDPKLTIHARAATFPMLVHEIVKGVYEILSLQGFGPDKEKNKGVVKRIDRMDNEPDDMRFGKFIYDAISKVYTDSNFDDPRIREFLFTEIYKLPNDAFFSFIENAINGNLTSQQLKWANDVMAAIDRDLKKDDTGLSGLDESLSTSLMELMMGEEQKLYHGTTHKFDCFRAQHIGSGTGAQVYGWGLYFSTERDVAESYANSVYHGHGQKQDRKVGGVSMEELGFRYDNPVFHELPPNLKTAEQAVEYAHDMIDLLKDFPDQYSEKIELYKDFIEIVQHNSYVNEPMIYIYEVIAHKDKKPSEYNYLDFSKSITDEQKQKILKKAESDGNQKIIDFIKKYNGTGGGAYSGVERIIGDPKQTSLWLLSAGIDGTRSGDYHIIFDEKAIQIVNVCNLDKKI
jgi:hypothetical protein